MMDLLLTYDVDTTTPEGRRRLRRVAKLCEGHGLRVQKSVFEIIASETDLLRLTEAVNDIINADTDSVRLYRLPSAGLADVYTLGTAQIEAHREDLVL
ncbi:CRISPR-associated endonuclease Cas2 [Streptomyces sp. NPDC058368]|uniref:CRISPR-associated endonuclease Cas2 n=1 Tax=Streptomyces sp. NPDC058368 TaxID=3346461 RepID=UPI00366546A5